MALPRATTTTTTTTTNTATASKIADVTKPVVAPQAITPLAENLVIGFAEPEDAEAIEASQLQVVIGNYSKPMWEVGIAIRPWKGDGEYEIYLAMSGVIYLPYGLNLAKVRKDNGGNYSVSPLSIATIIPPVSDDDDAQPKAVISFDYGILDCIPGFKEAVDQAVLKLDPNATCPVLQDGQLISSYIDWHTEAVSDGLNSSSSESGFATINTRRILVPQTPETLEILGESLVDCLFTNMHEAQNVALNAVQNHVNRISSEISKAGGYQSSNGVFTSGKVEYPLFAPVGVEGDNRWVGVPQLVPLNGKANAVIVLNQIQPSRQNTEAWTGAASNFLLLGEWTVIDRIQAPTPKARLNLRAMAAKRA